LKLIIAYYDNIRIIKQHSISLINYIYTDILATMETILNFLLGIHFYDDIFLFFNAFDIYISNYPQEIT